MFTSPAELARQLQVQARYLAEPGLAAAAFLAYRGPRPLLLEGEPGVGKTAFARAMAKILGTRVERVQCYPGLDTGQVLYEWNFPAQMLALRAGGDGDQTDRLPEMWSEQYLLRRPILSALGDGVGDGRPTVLLIDEIDRAEDDFEALLLQVLDEYEVSIPELGKTIRATVPPYVVLTSNRTREVHDAIKRRCLYHWINHPTVERETEILRSRVEGLGDGLAADIAAAMHALRQLSLTKPPSTAEAVDFARALVDSGEATQPEPAFETALSTLVKHHDDESAVRAALLSQRRTG